MMRLVRLELHTVEGIVPVIQFDDSTSIFRLGKVNNDDGNEPVRLIDDSIISCNVFVVLVLNNDDRLPLRRLLLDRSIMLRLGSVSILVGIIP